MCYKCFKWRCQIELVDIKGPDEGNTTHSKTNSGGKTMTACHAGAFPESSKLVHTQNGNALTSGFRDGASGDVSNRRLDKSLERQRLKTTFNQATRLIKALLSASSTDRLSLSIFSFFFSLIIRQVKEISGGVYMEEGQPSLPRSRVSVKFCQNLFSFI